MAEGTDKCQIFLDAIAADMLLAQPLVDQLDPIYARIAFNSQQYVDCISVTPPVPPRPDMTAEQLAKAVKGETRMQSSRAIATIMGQSTERARITLLHCVEHCRAAIAILTGKI